MAVVPAKVKKIDKKSKMVELEDGRKIPLPEDLQQKFFGTEASKKKEEGARQELLDKTARFPLGKEARTTLANLSEGSAFLNLANKYLVDPISQVGSSLEKGPGQEEMGFFARLADNVAAVGRGRRQGLEEINKESPIAAGIGKGLGIAADVAAPVKFLPKGPLAGGAVAGGLMGLGAGDKSLLTDPAEALKEAAMGAGLGGAIGAGVGRLSKIAQDRAAIRNYPELLKAHQEAGNKAQKEFLVKMAKGLDVVGKDIPGGIGKESMQVKDFVSRNIGMSSMAGTPQAKKLESFLLALEEAAPAKMTSEELKTLFSAVDGRLATATAEEVPILQGFKRHLVEQLPRGAAKSAVLEKYGSRFMGVFDKEVDAAVSSFLSDKNMVDGLKKMVGGNSLQDLAGDIKRFAKVAYAKMSPEKFANDLASGNLNRRLMWFFDNNQKVKQLSNGIEQTLGNISRINNQTIPISQLRSPEIQNLIKARDGLAKMRSAIENKLSSSVSRNSTAIPHYEQRIFDSVASKLADAVGEAHPVTGVMGKNVRPNMTPPPSPPGGAVANFFETPNFYSENLKKMGRAVKKPSNMLGAGLIGSALGVPKAAGAAGIAAGAAGLTAALRGATSPGALGNFARKAIRGGSLRLVVEAIAEQYPSYRNGVLNDPIDRRTAAAQIEQDQDLGLEDKAVLQARINRGQSLETLLEEDEDGSENA